MLPLRCKSVKLRCSYDGRLPEMGFPSGFDDVAIWIEALHADVLGLIPLLDDRDSVACEAVSESSDGIRTWKTDPEVEESRQPDRLLSRAEGERESVCVVESSPPHPRSPSSPSTQLPQAHTAAGVLHTQEDLAAGHALRS